MRDGVRLAYEIGGDPSAGGPPIVLVHGMRCDHTHMQPLFDHLRSSRRVVSLDLRGHGSSDAPTGEYSNEVMAGDIAWLAAHVGFERPVVIGHSFGGSLSLFLATAHPELVSGLVLLDSGVRSTAEKEAEMGAVIAAASRGVDPADNHRFLSDRLFGPDDDASVKTSILASMATTPEHASRAMGQTVLGFDSGTAATSCTVPTLFILADRPFSTPAMIAQLPPNWRVAQVVGAGHFVQVFAAAQVNAMVERFLEVLGSGRTDG